MDVERASDQIDILIERRHLRANTEQQNIEDLWKASTRRERDKRRRENAAAWYGHHEHMRELHSSLHRLYGWWGAGASTSWGGGGRR